MYSVEKIQKYLEIVANRWRCNSPDNVKMSNYVNKTIEEALARTKNNNRLFNPFICLVRIFAPIPTSIYIESLELVISAPLYELK